METLSQLEKEIREEELEALEKYRQGVGEPPTIYRPMGYLKGIDETTKDMEFVANEESVDRMGDVIEVAGWQLRNFKRNPVIMFSHDYRSAPVGTAPKVWTDDKQLLNTVRFDTDDPFGAFLQGKYERGIMRAESVGLRVLEWEKRELGKDEPPHLFMPMTIKKQELLEISLVSIPAHPRALKKMYGDKFQIVMPAIPEETQIATAEAESNPLEQTAQKVATKLREIANEIEAGDLDEVNLNIETGLLETTEGDVRTYAPSGVMTYLINTRRKGRESFTVTEADDLPEETTDELTEAEIADLLEAARNFRQE